MNRRPELQAESGLPVPRGVKRVGHKIGKSPFPWHTAPTVWSTPLPPGEGGGSSLRGGEGGHPLPGATPSPVHWCTGPHVYSSPERIKDEPWGRTLAEAGCR